MAKRLTDQLAEALRDLERDAKDVNDAIETGDFAEARRFLTTMQRDADTLDIVLLKMEYRRG